MRGIHYCPKCGFNLKTIGVDYEKPINAMCLKCKNTGDKYYCRVGLPLRTIKRKRCNMYEPIEKELPK